MLHVYLHVNAQVHVFLNIPQCDQNHGCVNTKAHVNATAGFFFCYFPLRWTVSKSQHGQSASKQFIVWLREIKSQLLKRRCLRAWLQQREQMYPDSSPTRSCIKPGSDVVLEPYNPRRQKHCRVLLLWICLGIERPCIMYDCGGMQCKPAAWAGLPLRLTQITFSGVFFLKAL